MDNTITDQHATINKTNRPKWWLWIAASTATCCFIAMAGVVGLHLRYSRKPENLSMKFDVPSLVKKNDGFDLVISMTNTGSKPFNITKIYLDEALSGSILDGAIVIDTEPKME